MSKGRLVIVGTGLITAKHITREATDHIRSAEIVYHITPDPLSVDYLKSLNNNLVSLADCYQKTSNRRETYSLMVERVMSGVHQGNKVVAIFYGHPGVFVTPSHELISQCRIEGIHAKMLPGVSAEDCLFADLGIDPGSVGCQSYEATFFLLNKIPINPASPLIIWQLGVIGDTSFSTDVKPAKNGMRMLKDKLLRYYTEEHSAIIYEAPEIAGFSPRIETARINTLDDVSINEISTLYLPAAHNAIPDTEFIKKWQLL